MTDVFITDFVATGHDETLLYPVTPAAEQWALRHLAEASRIGIARVIQRCGFSTVADAVQADGLTLTDGRSQARYAFDCCTA